jgi:hypothetical protein
MSAPMDEFADHGAITEITKVKETAERMANGETLADADQIRVLAGLVHQLAEQVERLYGPVAPDVEPR